MQDSLSGGDAGLYSSFHSQFPHSVVVLRFDLTFQIAVYSSLAVSFRLHPKYTQCHSITTEQIIFGKSFSVIMYCDIEQTVQYQLKTSIHQYVLAGN